MHDMDFTDWTRVDDDESDGTILVAKKGGKAIERGSTVILQVRLSDGTESQEFSLTR